MALKDDLKNEQKKIDEAIRDDYDEMDKQAYEHALGELSKENREEVARLEFSSKTKRVLAQRVGYHCSNPNCKVTTTIGPSDKATGIVLLGEAAHIIGAIQDGKDRLSPRADSTKSISEIISLENGIWLCKNCHKLVDSKTSTYTVAELKKWKMDAETKQAKRLEDQPSVFVEKYIYPSISVKKGIDSKYFTEKEWCLLAFMMSMECDGQALSFDADDKGKNLKSSYLNWMSKHAIDFTTAKINFEATWETIQSSLRVIVNNLAGLVSIDAYGLNYGNEYENFVEKFFEADDEALEKLIHKLSKI